MKNKEQQQFKCKGNICIRMRVVLLLILFLYTQLVLHRLFDEALHTQFEKKKRKKSTACFFPSSLSLSLTHTLHVSFIQN